MDMPKFLRRKGKVPTIAPPVPSPELLRERERRNIVGEIRRVNERYAAKLLEEENKPNESW